MNIVGRRLNIKPVLIASILLLAAFLVFLGFYGPSIDNSDNFLYVGYAHWVLVGGINILPNGNALASNYFQIFGISLMDIIFKSTLLSAAAFEFLMLSGTIVVIYLIGKHLFGTLGGLLSSFAYAISPLLVIETKTVGDVVPMAFFVSLAMLLYLLHSDKKRGGAYLLLSGFVVTAGMLVVYLSLLIFPTILILIVAEHMFIRKEHPLLAFTKDVSLFAAGILLGIMALVLTTYVATGGISEPFILFMGYFSQLKQSLPYNPLAIYLSWLFGHYSFNGIYGPIMVHYLLVTTILTMVFGFYLLKKALIPAVWIFTTLLLLSAITSSATIVPLERYIIIFMPAISLVIGGGVAKLIVNSKSKFLKKRYLLAPIMKVAVILIILVYSLISTYTMVQADSVSTAAYWNFMTAYRIAANESSILYAPIGQLNILQVYTNFSPNIQILSNISCGEIMRIANGSYVAIPINYNITCGMPIVYYPNKSELVKEYGTLVGNGIYNKLVYVIKIVK